MEKPTLPKGTRDFGPAQMAKRQFIFNNIRKVFQKYGFQPLETPAMENLSTLTGKYGEEGDTLLFKILNSGSSSLMQLANIKDFLLDYLKHFTENYCDEFGHDHNLFFTQIGDSLISYSKKNLEVSLNTFDLTPDEREVIFFFFANNSTIKRVEIFLSNFYHKADIQAFHPTSNPDFDLDQRFKNIRNEFNNWVLRQFSGLITEKGLRYDLTVPFARYVVMNRHEITFPFKRYQIQPVWRADRPQKGRYREFYQCDADVVGTDSLICEAEIILMIKEVFASLSISDYTVKINHRGVLSGLAELAGAKENQMALFVAIDKLDKIGEEKVKEELIAKGFSESSLKTVFEILNFKGTTEQKTELLISKFTGSENGNKGVNDLREVFQLLTDYGVSADQVEFDIALARGLSYYTGCIFEVKINNVAIGSVSGGGRYDNLTGVFDSKDKNSGVGISFGVDRLYDAMEELKLFPTETQISSKVLICHFDEDSKRYGLKVLQALRANGIASEIYPDGIKIQKQLDYANKKMIPFTLVIGSEEVKSGMLAFKNMKTGEQQKLNLDTVISLMVGR